MTLARWPDEAPPGSPADYGGNWDLSGYDLIETNSSSTSFTTWTNRLNRWTQASDIWTHGFFGWDWADSHIAISTINVATKTIQLGQEPILGLKAGQHYFVYNLLEEITEPGEWYLDRSSGILYFWPPSDIATGEAYVSTLSDSIISIDNASWITFKDITIEGAWNELIDIAGGTNVIFAGCTLRNAGTYAAYISGIHNGITLRGFVRSLGHITN